MSLKYDIETVKVHRAYRECDMCRQRLKLAPESAAYSSNENKNIYYNEREDKYLCGTAHYHSYESKSEFGFEICLPCYERIKAQLKAAAERNVR